MSTLTGRGDGLVHKSLATQAQGLNVYTHNPWKAEHNSTHCNSKAAALRGEAQMGESLEVYVPSRLVHTSV